MNVTATMAMNVAAVMDAAITEAVGMFFGILLVLYNEMEFVMPFWRDGFDEVFDRCIVLNFDELGVVMTIRVNVDFDFLWHDCVWLLITTAG